MQFMRVIGVSHKRLKGVLTAAVIAGFWVAPACAVPSFSRQTGLACSSCHTNPMELTPFGREFKLNGYIFSTSQKITAKGEGKQSPLDLAKILPLSVMLQLSLTATNSPQPATQNASFEFPQQASLFLSGAWTSHIGSFAQVTYAAQADHFSWDNTDIRVVNKGKLDGKDLVYGLTFNNNPTVEDLWNSTPAWGFPFVSSASAPTPTAVALINGPLAQDVAGGGAYAMWDNHLYLASVAYRSDHLGAPQPNPGTGFPINIRGIAPYWRAAWQENLSKNDYLEVGTFGMHIDSTPNSVVGLMDNYTDAAGDFQYEHTIPRWKNDVLTVRGSYIHENSFLRAEAEAGTAAFPSHHLDTAQINATYHFGNRYSGTFGWFNTTGTSDSLLYAPGAVTGSHNGDPHSSGYIANASWWPHQNVDVALQYTGYTRFNGGGMNYDGSGRSASGNNALYVLLWFIF
jgi:hypothetical protein